jgi:hypothetical protein
MAFEILEQTIEELELFYFGTSLDSHGHYFFRLDNDKMSCKTLNFPLGDGIPLAHHEKWPFNPESIIKSRKKGDVEFYNIKGCSIIAIVGSCVDERPNTKSVFFVYADLDYEQMKAKVLSNPTAKKIIDKMPFVLNW